MTQETDSLYHKIVIVLLTLVSLTVLVLGSTSGEARALAASAAVCETSGCVRSSVFGYGLLILIVPFLVCLFCTVHYFLLKLGFQVIKQDIRPRGLLFLTFFPFVGTSLVFPYLTHIIYEPGYQTDLRFLAYTLLKAGMLFINTALLFGSLPLFFRLNLLNTLKVTAIPLLLFGLLANSYFLDAQPHLHYLQEARTYQLAKYYLVDAPAYRAHCRADQDWCLRQLLGRIHQGQ